MLFYLSVSYLQDGYFSLGIVLLSRKDEEEKHKVRAFSIF